MILQDQHEAKRQHNPYTCMLAVKSAVSCGSYAMKVEAMGAYNAQPDQ